MRMDTAILEDLGLSRGEIRVYFALMKLGSTKVGGIIERSGMASSAVHNALKTLAEKGLITYIKKGKIKSYSAAPPGHMLEFIDEKREKLKAALPELEAIRKAAEERQEAEVYEGMGGFKALMARLLEGAKKGDEYLFFAVDVPEQNKEIQEVFARYDLRRKALGLIVKGLAPKGLSPVLEWRTQNIEVRYPVFPIPSNTTMCNDLVAFFSWEKDKFVGYIIQSQQIAASYREFFRKVWEKAGK